jgi:hypothetical protein
MAFILLRVVFSDVMRGDLTFYLPININTQTNSDTYSAEG